MLALDQVSLYINSLHLHLLLFRKHLILVLFDIPQRSYFMPVSENIFDVSATNRMRDRGIALLGPVVQN